jgi:putative salt-induced outer membrane protein YdiY
VISRRSMINSPVALALALGLMANLAGAQTTADKDKPPKEDWETGLNAGLNLTRGNSKTLMLNGGVISEYKKGANELRLAIQGAYGESAMTPSGGSNSTEQTTVQNAMGAADYKHLFTGRDYGYANGELMHDHIAGIDYRLFAGPGLGRYFLKSDRQTLSAEAGAAYVRQQLSGNVNNTVNLRLAQRYEIKPLAGSKLWESVEYLPAFNDFGNYFIKFEVGAEAAMTGRVNLRVVLRDQFNSRPAPDKERNDLQLIAGIGYKL